MLMALIAIGIAGLIVRAVSSGSDELVLSGLLPISQDVVTRVTVRSSNGESEARLVRIGDVWTINNQQAFPPKLAQFWSLVSDIDGARLIATNEYNHRRMGVAEDQGTVVSFYLDEFIQEQFIVGEWSSDVRLCYLRAAREDPGPRHRMPYPCHRHLRLDARWLARSSGRSDTATRSRIDHLYLS